MYVVVDEPSPNSKDFILIRSEKAATKQTFTLSLCNCTSVLICGEDPVECLVHNRWPTDPNSLDVLCSVLANLFANEAFVPSSWVDILLRKA